MRIALAQLNPLIGDINGNAQQILEVAQIASQAGVRLLLTPELSLCGYPPRDLLLNPNLISLMEKTLLDLAQQLPKNIGVLVGTATTNLNYKIEGGKPLFNSIAFLDQGEVKQYFHKSLLPTYDVFDENRYFESSANPNILELDYNSTLIRIGVTICEDIWNDEEFWGQRSYRINPLEELSRLNVDFLVNLSASPYTVGKQKIREAMLTHGVQRYHKGIIYVNQVGGNDDLIFDGSSVAFNKSGDLICRGKSFNSNLSILEYRHHQQDFFPVEKTLFSPNAHLIYDLPQTPEEEIWLALVLGVRDYTLKCGFSKVILGLSGGIDSALVAAIASEALGSENVLGVLMPSPYSSDHSITDAQKLVKNLGIKSQILPIEKGMNAYTEILEPMFQGTEFGLAEENIQSRIRGNLLMAIANKFGYLLLSTGNKSEISVGYCTLYGDMNGGLAVIADLPKTQVFALAQWLNRQKEIIPQNILIKPPSAELKPNQVDQDSLPPYDQLDDILYRMINHHQSPEQLMERGYKEEIINKITKLLFRAEFKRRQAPPGLKITDRAFGTGWRMPIASKW
jgi:NAD+ synthase (glutamine-hydrolysing)